MSDPFDRDDVRQLIRLALIEDLGDGDVTTEFTVGADARARGDVVAREDGVIAGLPLVALVLREFDPDVEVELKADDGEGIARGDVLAVISGRARPILSAERTVLNFLQRLSGIATLTRRFVDAVAGTTAKVLDTRKTTPGWRAFEKYAVRAGGGENHRVGLYDMALIKDNHRATMAQEGTPLKKVVERLRAERPGLLIEAEADTEDDVREALDAGADIILLDNMTPETMAHIVKKTERTPRRPLFEASGGVTLENVRQIAETGVDRISAGALTHSATALDIAVDFKVL